MSNLHDDDDFLDWLGDQTARAWQATKPLWLTALALYIGWLILRSMLG